MEGSVDEARLVERVRRGDAEAYGELVERHARRAFSIAYRLLAHREDAEDLVQDAFIAALEGIDGFDSGRPFGPWLYRIVTNRGLNARKARALRTTEEVPVDAASSLPPPDRSVERAEARARLGAALSALPERQRVVVQLYELDGFSGPEIAELLGLSEGTVRWHLHEARKALRAELEPETGGATE